jgi:hypothetical protein
MAAHLMGSGSFIAPTDRELKWRSRATSIDGIEQELARIWAQPNLNPDREGDEVTDRHVAARTSVMNLVVIARRPGSVSAARQRSRT